MHPWSPLTKLCATTLLPMLWFLGSSASINTSLLHTSLAKLLLANAEWFQVEEATTCFAGALICPGIFEQNCLPRMWYNGFWERCLVKNAIFSHSEGSCLHLTSLPWSLVSGCPGKRQLRPCSFSWLMIFTTWRSSMYACSEKEQEPGSSHTKRSY